MTAPDVRLRPAGAADRDFFARVYAAGRAEELAPVPFTPAEKEAFLAQQFAAQSAHYSRYYGDASHDVILIDGEPAGRLIVHRTPEHVLIVDIALLREQRGRGVGTNLLLPILEEGRVAGIPVLIHVKRDNRALRLYQRLGFAPIEEEGMYLTMERRPS
jgi:GNAT superfamily N-acetyltransferase